MTGLISESLETVNPPEADAHLARESSRRLAMPQAWPALQRLPCSWLMRGCEGCCGSCLRRHGHSELLEDPDRAGFHPFARPCSL